MRLSNTDDMLEELENKVETNSILVGDYEIGYSGSEDFTEILSYEIQENDQFTNEINNASNFRYKKVRPRIPRVKIENLAQNQDDMQKGTLPAQNSEKDLHFQTEENFHQYKKKKFVRDGADIKLPILNDSCRLISNCENSDSYLERNQSKEKFCGFLNDFEEKATNESLIDQIGKIFEIYKQNNTCLNNDQNHANKTEGIGAGEDGFNILAANFNKAQLIQLDDYNSSSDKAQYFSLYSNERLNKFLSFAKFERENLIKVLFKLDEMITTGKFWYKLTQKEKQPNKLYKNNSNAFEMVPRQSKIREYLETNPDEKKPTGKTKKKEVAHEKKINEFFDEILDDYDNEEKRKGLEILDKARQECDIKIAYTQFSNQVANIQLQNQKFKNKSLPKKKNTEKTIYQSAKDCLFTKTSNKINTGLNITKDANVFQRTMINLSTTSKSRSKSKHNNELGKQIENLIPVGNACEGNRKIKRDEDSGGGEKLNKTTKSKNQFLEFYEKKKYGDRFLSNTKKMAELQHAIKKSAFDSKILKSRQRHDQGMGLYEISGINIGGAGNNRNGIKQKVNNRYVDRHYRGNYSVDKVEGHVGLISDKSKQAKKNHLDRTFDDKLYFEKMKGN